MATDTTRLAEAIAAMRAAVAHDEVMVAAHARWWTCASENRVFKAAALEQAAGRVLLAALDGVPERLADLEQFEVAAMAFRTLVLPQNERLWALARAAGDLWDASMHGPPPDDEPLVAAVRDALTALRELEEKAHGD